MHGEFVLRIKLGNDAMQDGRDIGEALVRVAHGIRAVDGTEDCDDKIRDLNGNTVGHWELTVE